jgi:hypothetical protein
MGNSEGTLVDQLADLVADLKATVGDELCDRMIGGYSSRDGRGFMDHHRREARAHPFALGWDDLCAGIAKSEKEGAFQLSERAFFLVDCLHALKIVKNDPNFPALFDKLENPRQYFSTAFEAFVFATYHSMGTPISIVQESIVAGERRADFVSFCDGISVFLECKSIQDKYQIEDQIWSTIEDQISRTMMRQHASYYLSVEASRPLIGRDISPIIKAATSLMENYPTTSGLSVMDCQLQIRRVLEPGQMLRLPLHIPHGDKGRVRFEMEWHGTSGDVRKVAIMESLPFFDHAQEKAVARLLKDAADQVPKGAVGVVHLQVPYRISKLFLDVIDHVRPFIERELVKRSNICAVVVNGRFLNEYMAKTEDPIVNWFAVVPNFSSPHRLPNGFLLPGTCDINDGARHFETPVGSGLRNETFSVGSVGTIAISFGIYEPLGNQKGLYLLRHCSSDGREQLSVWQSYRNIFRIEVVAEQFGRRALDIDLNHLEIDVTHHMAFCWSEDGIRCAVNGEMIAA